MNDKTKPKEKDNWDKAEIAGKIISGVVIVIITLLIKNSADNIAASFKYGEFSQKLIADLSEPDSINSRVKKDLTLIALNRTVGEENPELVVDYATIIYENSELSWEKRNVALEIIYERDPAKAKSLREAYEKRKLSKAISDTNAVIQYQLRSNMDMSKTQMLLKNEKIDKMNTGLVYIQTNSQVYKDSLLEFKKELKSEGFKVPNIEVIRNFTSSSVRYIHDSDRDKAEKIAEILKYHVKINPSLIKIKADNPSAFPVGQIEVWIYKKL